MKKIDFQRLCIYVILILMLGYVVALHIITKKFVQNWGNESFPMFTAICTRVEENEGFFALFQRGGMFVEGNGSAFMSDEGYWLTFDNGMSYYVMSAFMEGEEPLCDQNSIMLLVGKAVTVQCLPSTRFPGCEAIVGLAVNGTTILDSKAIRCYFQSYLEVSSKGRIAVVAIPLVFFLLLEGIFAAFRIVDWRRRRKKEQQKQLRMAILRAEGKLHPKHQKQYGIKDG